MPGVSMLLLLPTTGVTILGLLMIECQSGDLLVWLPA